MAYEMRPNTGSLFANDNRETDKHPNAKGSALIDGVEYWVSAWTNTSQNGKKYQSLKFEPKEQQSGQPAQAPAPQPELEDSIPF